MIESAHSPAGPRSGVPEPLEPSLVDRLVRAALEEDLGTPDFAHAGDVTTDNLVGAGARARGRLVARAEGRLAGLDVFERAFALVDPGIGVERLAADGDAVAAGDTVARLQGGARGLLVAERTALNFLQQMSGVATLTACIVARAPGVRVLDTRKTVPGLRTLQKYAVRCGGGENHRFGLFDEAMVKDNHVDLCGGDVRAAVERVRAAVGPGVRITAEARTEREGREAALGGADVVLLDNMSAETMAEVVPLVRAVATRPVEIEASGAVTAERAGAIARAGVDRISIGALTHSAPALDLSLLLEALP